MQTQVNFSQLDIRTATRSQFVAVFQAQAQRIEELEAENARLKEQNAELASELYFYEGVVANPTLQGSLKAVVIGTYKAVGKSRLQGLPTTEKGLVRTYREDVARFAGCSAQTVSDGWRKLESAGLLERETVGRVEGGKIEKETYIGIPKQVLLNPAGVAVTEGLQGGKRIPTCRHCGSGNLEKTFICRDCGAVMPVEEAIPVSEELYQKEQEQRRQIAELEAPTMPAPDRDCIVCSAELGRPVRAWRWIAAEQMWRCQYQNEHGKRESVPVSSSPKKRKEEHNGSDYSCDWDRFLPGRSRAKGSQTANKQGVMEYNGHSSGSTLFPDSSGLGDA